MAIGRPISLTPNIATKNISSLATADQTEFTVTGGYRINEIAVYRNGVRLAEGRDFTASDGDTVNLVTAASDSDVIEFAVFDSFNVSDAIVSAASSQNLNGDFNVTGSLYAGSFEPSQFVAGIVTSVEHKISKNGKPYGNVIIEDFSDSYNFIFFSDDYVKFKNFFEEGWFLFLNGKMKNKWNNPNELEFKVDNISLLSKTRENHIKELHIKMDIESIDSNLINELNDNFDNAKDGNCHLKVTVCLLYTSPSPRDVEECRMPSSA